MSGAMITEASTASVACWASWAAARAAACASCAWGHAKRAWESVRCAWALLLATWRVAVVQRVMATHDFLVFKVIALNEDDGTDATVTSSFNQGQEWESGVRAATGWGVQEVPHMRVEVRYLSHGKKYRAVLRPGDNCTFPRDTPERHRGGPKGVMAAELVGDDITVNITRRVHKYEGPTRDFHAGLGLRVGVTDMFPLDDAGELKATFHTLRLIDAHARVVHVSMDCGDLAGALASAGKTE